MNTSCAPGACVSPPGGVSFCAVSGDPWPGCDPKVPQQNVCDGTVLYQCFYGYRQAGAPCSATCVSVGGTAICAESTTPWPGCDPTVPSQHVCDRDTTPIECQFGYRVRDLAPGRGDAPCPDGQRCVSDGTNADCVISTAILSPSCYPTGWSVACVGATKITCMDGYIIDNRRCASCSDQNGCTGAFEASCTVDADCAAGSTCLPGSTAGIPTGTCEVACTGTNSDNAQCQSAIVDSSLPYGFYPSTCGPGGWCGY